MPLPAILILAVAGLAVPLSAAPAIEDVRRLYDAAPVSATNPVLASVPECQIEIPVAEFRAFVNFDLPRAPEWRLLTLEEKHVELEKLIDDHFWVWRGYEAKADQTPDIAELINVSKIEAMKAMVIEQDVGPRAHNFEDYKRLTKELRQRIFDKAEINISSKGFETLNAALKRLNAADRTAAKAAGTNLIEGETPPLSAEGLKSEEAVLPLATWRKSTMTVGDVIPALRQLPPEKRPNLQSRETFVVFLREVMQDELMLAEARDRQLDQTDLVRQQVQGDRTGLVRQWALGQLTAKADAAMSEPANEARIRAWYDARRNTLYTRKDAAGKETVLEFDTDKELIANDYFSDLVSRLRTEELRRMRQGKKIIIDEKLLADLLVAWPGPKAIPPLESSKVAWNTDAHAYTVKPGETNASFTFIFTNLFSHELEIETIYPVNHFVSVQGPEGPWKVPARQSGEIRLDVDLRDKFGVGQCLIHVTAAGARKTLTLNITYPDQPIQ